MLRSIWTILTLRCEDADRLRTTMRRSEMSRAERVAERLHRAVCSSCRHAARQAARIDRGLASIAEQGRDAGWSEARAARLEATLEGVAPPPPRDD